MDDAPVPKLAERLQDGEKLLDCLWRVFNELYPTPQDCLEELYRLAGGARCRRCGNKDLDRHLSGRWGICRRCRFKTWFTAGTFFAGMRMARAWLAAIWLTERGVILTSTRLQKLVGIAQSSALNILRKIRAVLIRHMGDDAPVAPSSLFADAISRRSRLTPAGEHPLAEQKELQRRFFERQEAKQTSPQHWAETSGAAGSGADRQGQGQPGTSQCQTTGEYQQEAGQEQDLTEGERLVYDLLSSAPVHVDILCQRSGMHAGQLAATLTTLELSGLIACRPGGQYVRCPGRTTASAVEGEGSNEDGRQGLQASVRKFLDLVRSSWHGVSQKYLQSYLAAFWCYMEPARWHNEKLAQACLDVGRLTEREMELLVSPYMVKILPAYDRPTTVPCALR